MSINKNGVVSIDTSKIHNIINNPCETNTTTDWSFGGTVTLNNGVLTLTGTNPNIESSPFPVGENEIIVFEFTVSLPTPSTTTGGSGIYLGTRYRDSTDMYYWSEGKLITHSTGNYNPYFISAYNSTAENKVKTYILGKNVEIKDFIPMTEGSEGSGATGGVKILRVSTDTTSIRSGYNSNTSMVIQFKNLKLYSFDKKLDEDSANRKIGKGYLSFNNYIEI